MASKALAGLYSVPCMAFVLSLAKSLMSLLAVALKSCVCQLRFSSMLMQSAPFDYAPLSADHVTSSVVCNDCSLSKPVAARSPLNFLLDGVV